MVQLSIIYLVIGLKTAIYLLLNRTVSGRNDLSFAINLIETRKKLRRSTYCAFIDLKRHRTQLTENCYGISLIKSICL